MFCLPRPSTVRSLRLPATVAVVLCMSLPSYNASAQATLVDGFGGDVDMGTPMGQNDDGSVGPIDISSAFPSGANFYGTTYTEIYVNNNGNLTFNAAVSGYTPVAFPVAAQPMIAPYWGDVDTNGGQVNVVGDNETYYYEDAVDGRFIATWYDVGYYWQGVDLLNRFQVVLTARDDVAPGDFDIEYRYAACEWTTGDASGGSGGLGGTEAQMGLDAGDNINYYSHPDSQTPQILDLCTTSNVNDTGVWLFEIRSGNPAICGDGILSGNEACDDGNMDANDGCTACVEYFDVDGDLYYGDVDCDDNDATANPGATEVCDGVDNDCDGTIDNGFDVDGDGYSSCVDDCDDTDASINPAAVEVCDGVDQDCDGVIDQGTDCYDDDGDGYTENDGDCDEGDATINPAAHEICDGVEKDCDGLFEHRNSV